MSWGGKIWVGKERARLEGFRVQGSGFRNYPGG
jgi:hypothetical protein